MRTYNELISWAQFVISPLQDILYETDVMQLPGQSFLADSWLTDIIVPYPVHELLQTKTMLIWVKNKHSDQGRKITISGVQVTWYK